MSVNDIRQSSVQARSDHAELVKIAFEDSTHKLPRVPGVHLGKTERKILAMLIARTSVHREVIYSVLHGGDIDADKPVTQMSTVDVQISRLRKKLKYICEIKSLEGPTWLLTTEGKEKIKGLQEAEKNNYHSELGSKKT